MKSVVVFAALGLAAGLAGCVSSVTIPPQEASIKDACHGKDRAMASFGGEVVYRCGEGDRAKYAAYSKGALFAELNEVDAIRAAAGIHCISQGWKLNTPDFQVCQNETVRLTQDQAHGLRSAENSEADARRARAAAALAIVAAGAAAGAAAAATTPPPAPVYIQPLRTPVTCNSQRLGTMVSTNCF